MAKSTLPGKPRSLVLPSSFGNFPVTETIEISALQNLTCCTLSDLSMNSATLDMLADPGKGLLLGEDMHVVAVDQCAIDVGVDALGRGGGHCGSPNREGRDAAAG